MPRDTHSTVAPKRLRWRTSSFSGEGNCIEVAETGARILVRDSKDPAGGLLAVSAGAWTAFLAGVRGSEFDAQAPAVRHRPAQAPPQ